MQAYGKVSYSSRRVNAYFGALWTPTTSEGTLPAYTGLGPNIISTSRAANRAEPHTRLRDRPAQLHAATSTST